MARNFVYPTLMFAFFSIAIVIRLLLMNNDILNNVTINWNTTVSVGR